MDPTTYLSHYLFNQCRDHMLPSLLLSVVRTVLQCSLYIRKAENLEVDQEEGDFSFHLPREAPWPVYGDEKAWPNTAHSFST